MMMKLQFDLLCDKINTGYRVFVDNHLMTERDYIWTDEFITEHIPLNIKEGVHTIEVESLGPAVFQINNVRLNGEQITLVNGEFKV